MGVIPWSPLRNGQLSGKYRRNDASPAGGRSAVVPAPNGTDWDVIDTLRRVADEAGTTMARAALAWVRSRPGVASTLIGARTREQLEDNLGSLQVELTDDQLHELTRASEPCLNFPAFNNANFSPRLAFGGMTIDGTTREPYPTLASNATRY
jgi:aryl-alcohol dehydrogenase-like predicted oxidoreductase